MSRDVEDPAEPTEREALALGWLSAELAARAGAGDGAALAWFPEPPEWLDLWRKALEETRNFIEPLGRA